MKSTRQGCGEGTLVLLLLGRFSPSYRKTSSTHSCNSQTSSPLPLPTDRKPAKPKTPTPDRPQGAAFLGTVKRVICLVESGTSAYVSSGQDVDDCIYSARVTARGIYSIRMYPTPSCSNVWYIQGTCIRSGSAWRCAYSCVRAVGNVGRPCWDPDGPSMMEGSVFKASWSVCI